MRSTVLILAALCLEGIAARPQTDLSKSTPPIPRAESRPKANTYQNHAEAALDRLQQWYNHDTGLWKSYDPSWWQSANALTTLLDMVQAGSPKAGVIASVVIPNTFQAAGAFNARSKHGLKRAAATKDDHQNPFSNGFYDDMGWWAVAWMRAYDVTGNRTYLDTAEALFADMTTGWGTSCWPEGMWWDKQHTHIDPIADTLFLETATHLANRVQADQKKPYVDWAVRAWDGLRKGPMYVSSADEHYVTAADGVDPKTCQLKKDPHGYTYSNGALVSGLVALSNATGDRDYLQEAHNIAHTVMKIMVSKDGILIEPGIDQAHPGESAPQFKGVFMRALARLHAADPRAEYHEFAQRCADSIWDKNRQGEEKGSGGYGSTGAVGVELGPDWNGPFYGPANASPQSSAMDGLVAAWAMTRQMEKMGERGNGNW
ncbi:glycosyl hydrolase [Apiospora saccharicola]